MNVRLVGRGRMGANMSRRWLRHGHTGVGYARHADTAAALVSEGAISDGATSLADFVGKLASPRIVWLMVPAASVDDTLDQLVPLLGPRHVVVDGGNSYYRDDIRRAKALEASGIRYVDCGTSGGVRSRGARAASVSRSARFGWQRAPGSSLPLRARCGRCPGCRRARAARTSTSTPTGTWSGSSNGEHLSGRTGRRAGPSHHDWRASRAGPAPWPNRHRGAPQRAHARRDGREGRRDRRPQGSPPRAIHLHPRDPGRGVHRAGRGPRHDGRSGVGRRRSLRDRPAPCRARLLPRPDPRDRWGGRAVHRQQPPRDGMGGPADLDPSGRTQLGDRLCRQPRRGGRDSRADRRGRAVPFWGRGRRGAGALDGGSEGGARPAPAFVLGILCNGLVCLAVWLSYSARTTTDPILAIVGPIAAFVAMGFEHSVANMYFIPVGMLIRWLAPADFWSAIGHAPADYEVLDWSGLLGNLVPVTLGNIVGGTILVGAVYWLVYLRGTGPHEVRSA